MEKTVKGELTAFLSLVFLLLLALTGGVLESASIQVLKNEKRADASRAAESVFAEYQRELLEEYEIFALEGSYETGRMSESNILNRLLFYGAENMETEIEAVRYLTDQSGQEFYRQAVAYEKERTGIAAAERLIGDLPAWKEQDQSAEEYEQENIKANQELDDMLQDEEQGLPQEENPPDIVKKVRERLPELVLPEGFELSVKEIDISETVSKRAIQTGYGSLAAVSPKVGDTVFFNLYLADKFGYAAGKKEGTTLDYEPEYLLAGQPADAENLEAAVKKLCMLRFAADYAYLLTDQVKQGEAEALALTLCTLLTVPGITEIVKHAVLMAWAYGEAVMDVKALLSGKRVALIKSEQTWQLSLSGLMKLDQTGGQTEVTDTEGGYTYRQYLQAMLFLKKKEELTVRALDLIEQNLRVKHGKTYFKADACITGAAFQMSCPLRRGVKYDFRTIYQYY